MDVLTTKLDDLTPKCSLKSYKYVEPVMTISEEDQSLNQLFAEDKLISTFDRVIHSDQYCESRELVNSIKKHNALKL